MVKDARFNSKTFSFLIYLLRVIYIKSPNSLWLPIARIESNTISFAAKS